MTETSPDFRPRSRRRRGRSGALAGWLPLLLALLSFGPAEAQRGTTEMDVVVAALPYLRATLPAGKVTLDPEPFCEARLIGWNCPAALRRAADSLGVRLNSRAFTHVCLGGPPGCRLVGADALVVLGPPLVDRSRATLNASVWWRAGPGPRPVDQRRFRLRLAWGPDGWEVVGEEPLEDEPGDTIPGAAPPRAPGAPPIPPSRP